MRHIVTSDIHGCCLTFSGLLDKMAFSQADHLYVLGDYVDRGPDSKGVIDLIWQLQKQGYGITCLKGNHEELVLRAASGNFTFLEKWLLTDGRDTMNSFGVSQCSDIPKPYLEWMANLPYFIEIQGYILVHAGLDFQLTNPFSDRSEMCWLRNWYGDIHYDWLGDRIILHGHTPMNRGGICQQLQQLDSQRYLDLDAGCVYADPRHWKAAGLGHLCAFDVHSRELFFQPNVDV